MCHNYAHENVAGHENVGPEDTCSVSYAGAFTTLSEPAPHPGWIPAGHDIRRRFGASGCSCDPRQPHSVGRTFWVDRAAGAYVGCAAGAGWVAGGTAGWTTQRISTCAMGAAAICRGNAAYLRQWAGRLGWTVDFAGIASQWQQTA